VRIWLSSIVLAVSFLLSAEGRPAVAQESAFAGVPEPQQTSLQTKSVSIPADRSVDVRELPANILQDQQDIFCFPQRP
jgi:hypothetical protein